MSHPKFVRTQIYLMSSQKLGVEAKARRTGKSFAQAFRDLLKLGLGRRGNEGMEPT